MASKLRNPLDAYYNPEKDKLFEAVLGRCIVGWNDAEYQVRDLLAFLAADRRDPRGFGPLILVAEMTAWRLLETLQTFADAMLEDEQEKALVKHVASLFGALIPYRNHYVHGLIFITDENVGCIGGTTAKGKLRSVGGDVAIEEIGAFLDKVGELLDFVYDVLEFLKRAASDERPEPPKMPEPMARLAKQTIILPLR